MSYTEEYIDKEIEYLEKLRRKIRSDAGKKRSPVHVFKNKQYISYMKRANAKGFEFELKEEDFDTVHEKECYYCGDSATGYDRLDSKKGYSLNNVVPACGPCNMMKNTATVKDFLGKIKQIHSHMNL